MKILFLDQSGKPGGAELCLLDIAKAYRPDCLVGLFADGSYRNLLEQQQIPVRVLIAQPLSIRRESRFVESARCLKKLIPLIDRVARLSREYDLIYANTQKALVVGALAGCLSRRPLIYHLRDILSVEHFSPNNLRLAVTLANRFASLVIANSQATRAAFVEAGGRPEIAEVVYNGFEPDFYQVDELTVSQVKKEIGGEGRFTIGQFSRLSPWKGQHILLEALAYCPDEVGAVFVGDALFGEQEYVEYLQQKVKDLGLENRVRFLGFRSDIAPLMAACDLVAHTSTAPEPFGRVIVEAMLCGRPVVAAQAGGAVELIESEKTGWLVPPGDARALASAIARVRSQPERAAAIASRARLEAGDRFHLDAVNGQIARLLDGVLNNNAIANVAFG